MRTLAEHMSVYAAHHRHPVNRGIHFVFVPAIVWSLMVALDRVALGTFGDVTVTLAMLVTAMLLLWYLSLDLALGVAGTAVFTVLLVAAIQLNLALPAQQAWWVAGTVFVTGWVAQFIGHGVWEKRRPALVDNLFQVFVAPLFLISETAFALGLKKNLQAEVTQKMQAHLPGAA